MNCSVAVISDSILLWLRRITKEVVIAMTTTAPSTSRSIFANGIDLLVVLVFAGVALVMLWTPTVESILWPMPSDFTVSSPAVQMGCLALGIAGTIAVAALVTWYAMSRADDEQDYDDDVNQTA